MSVLQDTVEIGPFEISKDLNDQVIYNPTKHGTLTDVLLLLFYFF